MHLTPSNAAQKHNWTFTALGTTWNVETFKELPQIVKRDVRERIELFDRTYSRFRRDSLVRQLRHPGVHTFPEDITPLLALYHELYVLTDKKMTPMIGSLLEEAGYDDMYSLQSKDLHAVLDMAELGWDGARTLYTTQPVSLDVGAAGKGYLVDIIAKIMHAYGITTYVIDASGDIVVRGASQTVGLEHPFDSQRVIGAIEVSNESLCASANNRRQWGDYHHIFDPSLRDSVRDVIATWVIAPHGLIADALATALFFVPPDRLMSSFDISYVVIKLDGSIDYSPRFEGQLFV